ncbi:hypothetical protein TeGR_g12917 [Tetraparma gracilis]|nr:hypothetical protein TeGR_g12917 [Tetraparma gracilis]
MGEPQSVIVDSLIPVDNASPLFASSRTNQAACFSLIEKALAKLSGASFKNLVGGNVAESLYDLLGVGVEDLHLDDRSQPPLSPANLKTLVLSNLLQGNLVGTGNIDTSKPGQELPRAKLGIRKNHAFAVVNATDSVVTVYNPQGHDDGYTGTGGTDGMGTLSMNWKDFHSCFNRLQIAPLSVKETHPNRLQYKREWSGVGGCSNFPGFRKNGVLVVDIEPGNELFLMMGQIDRRGLPRGERAGGGDAGVSYDEIGITVVELKSPAALADRLFVHKMCTPERYKVFAKTRSFANRRDNTLWVHEKDIKKKTTLGIVFSTFHPDVRGDYFCEVRSRHSVADSAAWTDDVQTTELSWTGEFPASLKLSNLKGATRCAVYMRQTAARVRVNPSKGKPAQPEPVGCWVLAPNGTVLCQPSFVKATESSTFVDLTTLEGGELTIAGRYFKGAKGGEVTVEVMVEGADGGATLVKMDEDVDVEALSGQKKKAKTKTKKMKAARPGFGQAKKTLEGLGDMYAGL